VAPAEWRFNLRLGQGSRRSTDGCPQGPGQYLERNRHVAKMHIGWIRLVQMVTGLHDFILGIFD
jgi:hypothetical protein